MRVKDVILSLMSLALVGAGSVLIVTFFLGPGGGASSDADEPQNFDVPVLAENTQEQDSERRQGPEDTTLTLDIPKMLRIEDSTVPSTQGNDEDSLRDYAAIHLEGTGFPWEREANVYIAGHRLGYPDTASFLAFYDLDQLERGDEVTVTDADGNEYVYSVFRKVFASPTDLSVTQPMEGKDILTLQTCTLPDYAQRLIVQAEKVA